VGRVGWGELALGRNDRIPIICNTVARNGNKVLPFSATLLPGVDRPLQVWISSRDLLWTQTFTAASAVFVRSQDKSP